MKKQIVMATTALMLVAGVVSGVNSQEAEAASKKVSISKKNFPDQVFRELVKSNYDKNKDKKLSASEIKKAKKFGSSSCKNSVKIKKSKYGKYVKKYVKDIKSFKGIEKLTNLQKLVANKTSVKTINLKKNKNLTYLEMTDGRLTKVDLNNCKKLKYVYLQYNQLTSLKMSKCKKLLKVNLTGHMVKKIKIDRNKKTEVIGEKYYAPYKSTKISNKFTHLNDGGIIDADGNYCVYEWSADNSSCTRNTINGAGLTSQAVPMDANASAKARSMQKITAQWKDVQGNFYFVADKDGDMVANTVYYIYKINAQGAVVSEVKLNDKMVDGMFGAHMSMSALQVTNDHVVLGVFSDTKDGVIYVDTNKMVVTRQATCSFIPVTAEGDIIAGYNHFGREVIVSKFVEEEKVTLEDNTEVSTGQLSSGHTMKIPVRYSTSPCSIQIKNNYLYLVSGEGFYKAKLTAAKFTQLYGISKLSSMQDKKVKFALTVKNEKEIYLISTKTEDEKISYTLQKCTIA